MDLEIILDLLKKLILEQQVFQTATVYAREELPGDPPVEDTNSPAVYLKPLDPVVPESDFHLDFMGFPIQVAVKFEGRADETQKDDETRYALLQKRYEYFEGMRQLAKKFPTDSPCYKVDARDARIHLVPTAELLAADKARPEQIIHRTGLTLIFNTVRRYD